MGLSSPEVVPSATQCSQPCAINTAAALFQHIPACFLALHLVYEVGRFGNCYHFYQSCRNVCIDAQKTSLFLFLVYQGSQPSNIIAGTCQCSVLKT